MIIAFVDRDWETITPMLSEALKLTTTSSKGNTPLKTSELYGEDSIKDVLNEKKITLMYQFTRDYVPRPWNYEKCNIDTLKNHPYSHFKHL